MLDDTFITSVFARCLSVLCNMMILARKMTRNVMFCYSVSCGKVIAGFYSPALQYSAFYVRKSTFYREKWAVRRSEKQQMELQEVANEYAKGYEWRGRRL